MAEPAFAHKYRSLFVIGRGGMGSVEAAVEIEAANDEKRVVALKRLLPHAAQDPRRAEMFRREARLATLLDHPNVVRAYAFRELEGEMLLAMEYVEGQPLSRVLRALAAEGKELAPDLVAYVLAEICEGLEAVHELADERGQLLKVVHRDVSPHNVMLGYDGTVKLLDFGVAKIDTECVTKTGEVKGKTAYMSPEQAMGDSIDRRSDLFGVGAILFECFARRRMWGDGTDMEILRKLALEKPPSLSTIAATIPLEMGGLYDELVAREAKDRPATARRVADRLRALTRSEDPARALRALLATHFAEHAAEQRERLRAALEAPPEVPIETRRDSVSAPKRRVPMAAVVVLAVVAVGFAGWRVSARGDATPPPTTTTVARAVETTAPSAIPKTVAAEAAPSIPTTPTPKAPPRTPPPFASATPSVSRTPAPPASSRATLDVDPTPF